MTTETLHRRHTGRLLQSQPVGVKRPPWTWVCEQLRREPRNLTLKALLVVFSRTISRSTLERQNREDKNAGSKQTGKATLLDSD
jgi:hypothetical protein